MADQQVDGSEAKDKFNRWASSMETMLGSVNSDLVKASSICVVPKGPKQLRKPEEEAYIPKVVSIGPLHYRTAKELLYMEEIKWRCMSYLLCHRTTDPEESLKKCSELVYDSDEVVRACYANDINFDSYDLAKILVVDACFLLELLMSNYDKVKKSESGRPSPGAEVGKSEEVLSDLILLENQIPLPVLNRLYRELFMAKTEKHEYDEACQNEEEEHKYGEACQVVNELVLSLFGYSSTQNSSNSAHILELLHSHLTTGNHQRRNDVSIRVGRSLKTEKPKLNRCATSLEAAGVTIEPLGSEAGARIELGCDFEFRDKTLKIQRLPIKETTEVMWRNFIAWEKFGAMKQGTSTICKFSQYALLFKGLICCEHDIQLLIDRKVLLVNDAESSNEDLVTMLSKITEGLEDVQMDMDSGLGKVFKDLNSHLSTVTCAAKNGRIMWHFMRRYLTAFGNFCRNWFNIREFYGNYCLTGWRVIALISAIVVSVATVILTVLSIFQLIHPVNSRSSVLSSKGLVFRFVD